MYFDEKTISRGLDELAVKWDHRQERFRRAPLAPPKREWLIVSGRAPFAPKEPENALETPPKPVFSLYTIRAAVLKVCQLNKNEFISNRRSYYIVKPRQFFYYLCKKHTSQSFPAIGQRAGGKDHSTIMHGVRKIEALVKSGDARATALIEAIEKELWVL